jgi:cytochrome P450
MFGTNMAAVGTVNHDVHRQRRAALSPFFSKKSVTELEPIIQAQINKLCIKLAALKGASQVVNLSDALTCLSADIISDCAFGESYGLLDFPDFAPEWRKFMMELSLGTHLMKQFGWAYRLVMTFTPWLLSLVHPLSRKLGVLRKSESILNSIEHTC